MAKPSYSGLCVGGPRDGRSVTCERATMRLPLPPPFQQTMFTLPGYRGPDHFEYQHVTIDVPEEGETGSMINGVVYGFWVPTGERHPRRYILDSLAKAYGGRNG